MVTALAREIHDGDLLGVGLGTPLAVLAGLLARRTHAPDAHLLVGGAVDPDADFATVLGGPGALAGTRRVTCPTSRRWGWPRDGG